MKYLWWNPNILTRHPFRISNSLHQSTTYTIDHTQWYNGMPYFWTCHAIIMKIEPIIAISACRQTQCPLGAFCRNTISVVHMNICQSHSTLSEKTDHHCTIADLILLGNFSTLLLNGLCKISISCTLSWPVWGVLAVYFWLLDCFSTRHFWGVKLSQPCCTVW